MSLSETALFSHSAEWGSASLFALSAGKDATADVRLTGLDTRPGDAWLAIARESPFWFEPKFPADAEELSSQPIACLFFRAPNAEGETCWQVWLPVCGVGHRASLTFSEGDFGLSVRVDSGQNAVGQGALLCASGPRLQALLAGALRTLRDFARGGATEPSPSENMPSFRLREEKTTPAFLDLFGWCTWDAFYKDVDAAGVKAGLDTFGQHERVPGFMILDDGWQPVKDFRFVEFGVQTKKFPEGIAGVVRVARQAGVRQFGIWHALQGYWQGVDPEGPIGRDYAVENVAFHSENYLGWPEQFDAQRRSLVAARDIDRFYQDFYAWLAAQGVDFVKVDNQGMLDDFCGDELPPAQIASAYQRALQGATATRFGGALIHCMANAPDILQRMSVSNVFRSSDDFYPDAGLATQAAHLINNAYNALLVGHFAVPDWDMFQSHHASAAFHAIGRAISGGPIYFSDKPGESDFALIDKLTFADGRALRFPQPGRLMECCVATDCRRARQLLKVVNERSGTPVVALFHVSVEKPAAEDAPPPSAAPITERILPGEIAVELDLPPARMHVWSSARGYLGRLTSSDSLEVSLEACAAEMLSFAPEENGRAVFGLTDKLATPAAIVWQKNLSEALYADVLGPGEFAFWTEKAPTGLAVNDKPLAYDRTLEGVNTVMLTEPGVNRVRVG